MTYISNDFQPSSSSKVNSIDNAFVGTCISSNFESIFDSTNLHSRHNQWKNNSLGWRKNWNVYTRCMYNTSFSLKKGACGCSSKFMGFFTWLNHVMRKQWFLLILSVNRKSSNLVHPIAVVMPFFHGVPKRRLLKLPHRFYERFFYRLTQ